MSSSEIPLTAPKDQPPLMGLAALMRQAFAGVDLTPIGQSLIERAGLDPSDANALMDLSTVLQLMGQRDTGLSTQLEAFKVQSLYRVPSKQEARLQVLALMAPGDLMANSPLEFLLEDSDVQLTILYVGSGIADPPELPEHDLLFVAIAESERNIPILEALTDLLKTWPRPVVNRPELIARLSRDGVCALLGSAPGMLVPAACRAARDKLQGLASEELPVDAVLGEVGFPMIVRPVDSHAGHGLQRLERQEEVVEYLLGEAAESFFISPFIDYRSRDGSFRKYRIVLIAGRPYLCHMAISEHWMIHYLNAGMSESEEKRAEEARTMADFEDGFARRHSEALQAIYQRSGLDYVGIDCGEMPDGRLLVFEVDSCMIVHAMDPAETYPYKQPQMKKIFGAFRSMLFSVAGVVPPSAD